MRNQPEKGEKKKPGRVPKSAGGRRATFRFSDATWERIEKTMEVYEFDQTAAVEWLINESIGHLPTLAIRNKGRAEQGLPLFK